MCNEWEIAFELAKDTLLAWSTTCRETIYQKWDQMEKRIRSFQTKKAIKLENESLKQKVSRLEKELSQSNKAIELFIPPIRFSNQQIPTALSTALSTALRQNLELMRDKSDLQ